MNEIINKQVLAEKIKKIEVRVPEIAAKALPGQFVVLRINEEGERIPLTIQGSDHVGGTVSLVFLEIGKTTTILGNLEEGDRILNVAGPLGTIDISGAGSPQRTTLTCFRSGVAPVAGVDTLIPRGGG